MADAYVQTLLGDGETIRAEARQHPMALIRFALQPILVFLAALVCLAIGTWLTPDGQGLFSDIVRWIDTLLGLVTAGLFILAVFWLPIQAFRWTKRRYMVTDRRVLYADGVLRKRSMDAGLNMITDVGFQQGFLGRKMGYGDLLVATASSRPLAFRQMRDPLEFKKTIMAAQHATVEQRADEILVSKGLQPARAPAAAASAAPVAPTPPVEPPPPVTPAWDGSDIPHITEDDAPPSDPLIFGAPGEARQPAEVKAVAGAAAAAPNASTPVETTVEPVVEAVEHPAADATDGVEPTTDAPATTPSVEPTTDAPATTPSVVPTTDAPATTPSVAPTTDAPATTPSVAPGGHVAALGDADAATGGLVDDAKGSGADSLTSAIAELAQLRDSGVLTDEEYESRKQELLDRL